MSRPGSLLAATLIAYLMAAALLYLAAWRRMAPKRWLCWLNGFRFRGAEGVAVQVGQSDCGARAVENLLGQVRLGVRRTALSPLERTSSMLQLSQALADHGLASEGVRFGSWHALHAQLGRGRLAITGVEPLYAMPWRSLVLAPARALCSATLWLRRRRVQHWVVISGRTEGGFEVLDSFLGRYAVAGPRFDRIWSHKALLIDVAASAAARETPRC